MCILFIAINQHQDYPLIIAANRDEYYPRPTAESAFWTQHPDLLAGRDLQAGGTWMGITQQGRVAALTNIRDPQKISPQAKSRGELVTGYLLGNAGNPDYLARLQKSKQVYNGYNLLFGDWQNLWVYNNHLDQKQSLSDGVYGLSNAHLDSPWPKLNRGVTNLQAYCQQQAPLDTETLFALLRDDTQAEDKYLPQTGVPIEWERTLSSIFIQTQGYGTRASTLLLVDRDRQVSWHERSFNQTGKMQAQRDYHFAIK